MDILAYTVFIAGSIFFAPLIVMIMFDVDPIDGKFWKTWQATAAVLSVFLALSAAVTLFVWSVGRVFQ